MREEMATIVHAVVGTGLDLRRRLLAGEELMLEAEQATLVTLLQPDYEARRIIDYGGDDPDRPMRRPATETTPTGPFLGARYALTCWLDEIFILDSTWSQTWNEHKLEVRLYASNDRAWRFWEQARIAADRGQTDALEVYFLCIMLGFSGELLEEPKQLLEWVASLRSQLKRVRQLTWRPPVGREVGTRVPPLRGRKALRRLLFVASLVVLALIPLVSLVLARRLS